MNGKNMKLPKNIKAILLDLDDTLYDYQVCNEAAKKSLFAFLKRRLGLPLSHITNAFDGARKRVHTDLSGTGASHSRFLYIQKTVEHLSSKTDISVVLEAYEIFWNTFLSRMKLFPGVKDFLKKMHSQSIRIAIVTDLTAHIQFRKLKKLTIDSLIDFVISSEEAGREKPETPIFKLALEKLGMKSQDVCMIGDHPEKDMKGSQSLNIKNIFFTKEKAANFFKSI